MAMVALKGREQGCGKMKMRLRPIFSTRKCNGTHTALSHIPFPTTLFPYHCCLPIPYPANFVTREFHQRMFLFTCVCGGCGV